MNHSAENDTQESFNLPDCSLPHTLNRDLSQLHDPFREALIGSQEKLWVNGSVITYYFFQHPSRWRGGQGQEDAVRSAFQTWQETGLGLRFTEVQSAREAMIKIGFEQGAGSWSYVGRDCLKYAAGPEQRTTNYGWDLTTAYGRDTALHEIGHVLGLNHAHQNSTAGIVWDENKVLTTFAGPPNNWDESKIRWNILRKVPAEESVGSAWDKNSIMQYSFPAGLILNPEDYQHMPLVPEPGLSPVDIDTIRRIYPPLTGQLPELQTYRSEPFSINAGEQLDFIFVPEESRRYTLQTFGRLDTLLVLFEEGAERDEYLAADDDSGTDYNASISLRLLRGRRYIVRARLYFSHAQGSGSIMIY